MTRGIPSSIGRLLFWILVSWVFPVELLTCRGFGERYAGKRRAAFSLLLLFGLALATGLGRSWRAALPVFVFAGLTGATYVLHRIATAGRHVALGRPDPWGWGIPPGPFRNHPRFFWLVAQPGAALAFAFGSFFFSWALGFYFALAAPLLWIFRKLAPPVLLRQGAPPPIDPEAAPPPHAAPVFEQASAAEAFWLRAGPWEAPPVTDSADLPFEEVRPPQAARRFPSAPTEAGLLFLGAAAGLLASLVGLRSAQGVFNSSLPNGDLFASCVRAEQERLAAALPAGWSLQLYETTKEEPLSEEAVRTLLSDRNSPLLQAMKRSWAGEPVYLATGDFLPRAAMAVRFPSPGIVIEWIPWAIDRARPSGPLLLLYVQTSPESAEELQNTLRARHQDRPFRFGPQSRLVVFDVGRIGRRTILHCVSTRSFSFRIGSFTLSQELAEPAPPSGRDRSESGLEGQETPAPSP